MLTYRAQCYVCFVFMFGALDFVLSDLSQSDKCTSLSLINIPSVYFVDAFHVVLFISNG